MPNLATNLANDLSASLASDLAYPLFAQLKSVAPGIALMYQPGEMQVLDGSLVESSDNLANPGAGDALTAAGAARPTYDATTYARPVWTTDGVQTGLEAQPSGMSTGMNCTQLMAGWNLHRNVAQGGMGSSTDNQEGYWLNVAGGNWRFTGSAALSFTSAAGVGNTSGACWRIGIHDSGNTGAELRYVDSIGNDAGNTPDRSAAVDTISLGYRVGTAARDFSAGDFALYVAWYRALTEQELTAVSGIVGVFMGIPQ